MTTKNAKTETIPEVDLTPVMNTTASWAKRLNTAFESAVEEYAKGFKAFAALTKKPVKSPQTVNAYHKTIKETVMAETGWSDGNTRKQFSIMRDAAKLPKCKPIGGAVIRERKAKKDGEDIPDGINLTLASSVTAIEFNADEAREQLYDAFRALYNHPQHGKMIRETILAVVQDAKRRGSDEAESMKEAAG